MAAKKPKAGKSTFSNKELEALTTENAGDTLKEANGITGAVRVKSDGLVSVDWSWRYRFDGKVKELRLGSWPKQSMPKIRDEQDDAAHILKDGKDPAVERKVRKLKAMGDQASAIAAEQARIAEVQRIANRRTVEQAVRTWLAAPGKRSGKPKSAELIRRFERDVLPSIGNMALEDVKKGDIRTLLATIEARGALVMARHMVADLRQFFDYCVGFDWLEVSPVASIKRVDVGARASERERVLSEAEIRALPTKIEAAEMFLPSAAAIWIMLSTCCRIGELSQAKWVDVDLDVGAWRIPPDNSKNGKEHIVSLSAFAIRHFKAIHAFSGTRINDQGVVVPGEWVMPAKHNDDHVCSKSLAKQIGDRQRDGNPMKHRSPLVDALVLPGGKWTPHDLRRTGATLMVALGVMPEVVERCLNHVEANRVKRIYQRHDYKVEMRAAWQLLGERLDLLTRVDADNVVTLRAA